MGKKFYPISERAFLKDDLLPTMPPLFPEGRPASSIPVYIKGRMGSLARCYWFGLADEARPKLTELLRWMEANNPPDLSHWPRGQTHYRAGHTSQFMWWQSIGLSNWLLNSNPSTAEFARSIHVEWEGWSTATAMEAAQDRCDRQAYLSERLATCLTANEAAFGLRFYDAVQPRAPFNLGRSVLEYGRWASAYLEQGHSRDATFVIKGEEMFKATFLPFFFPSSFWFDATLWLKAIYFDSGVTRTAEETIFRAYDLMPGIPRPDFVPR